jgi:hypothetical protein
MVRRGGGVDGGDGGERGESEEAFQKNEASVEVLQGYEWCSTIINVWS